MQFKTSAAVALATLLAHVHSHGVVTEIQGSNKVKMQGLGIIDGTPRDSTGADAQADIPIFKGADPLGATTKGGNVNAVDAMNNFFGTGKGGAKKNQRRADAKGVPSAKGSKENGVAASAGQGAKSGLPTVGNDGVINLTYHQVNADGAGPLSASVDPTSGGTDEKAFQTAQMITDVPGTNGRSNAQATDFQISVQMPKGLKCTGTVAGQKNVCVVRVKNPNFGGSALFTNEGAGGAGGAAASSSDAGNSAASASDSTAAAASTDSANTQNKGAAADAADKKKGKDKKKDDKKGKKKGDKKGKKKDDKKDKNKNKNKDKGAAANKGAADAAQKASSTAANSASAVDAADPGLTPEVGNATTVGQAGSGAVDGGQDAGEKVDSVNDGQNGTGGDKAAATPDAVAAKQAAAVAAEVKGNNGNANNNNNKGNANKNKGAAADANKKGKDNNKGKDNKNKNKGNAGKDSAADASNKNKGKGNGNAKASQTAASQTASSTATPVDAADPGLTPEVGNATTVGQAGSGAVDGGQDAGEKVDSVNDGQNGTGADKAAATPDAVAAKQAATVAAEVKGDGNAAGANNGNAGNANKGNAGKAGKNANGKNRRHAREFVQFL